MMTSRLVRQKSTKSREVRRDQSNGDAVAPLLDTTPCTACGSSKRPASPTAETGEEKDWRHPVRAGQEPRESVGECRTRCQCERQAHTPQMPRNAWRARGAAGQHNSGVADRRECEHTREEINRDEDRVTGPNPIRAQLRRGVPADMVIMSREGLAELLAEDRIAIGSDVYLGPVPLGVGVRAGTSRPNIGTVDAFKQTLLGAKSIGIQSSSAIYLRAKVFPQLGIAGALEAKLSNAGAAGVAAGEAEMIVLPVSEILPCPSSISSARFPPSFSSVQREVQILV
jgi:hypothetical protein